MGFYNKTKVVQKPQHKNYKKYQKRKKNFKFSTIYNFT